MDIVEQRFFDTFNLTPRQINGSHLYKILLLCNYYYETFKIVMRDIDFKYIKAQNDIKIELLLEIMQIFNAIKDEEIHEEVFYKVQNIFH